MHSGECVPGPAHGTYEHQVFHQAPLPGEVLLKSGVATSPEHAEGLSVTVMCRAALFAANRSRLRKTTPSPQVFFRTLVESFRQALAEHIFVLPTLAEAKAAEGSAPTPPSLKKARAA